MRKLTTLATALAMLALALPMQAAAETATKPVTKTEAPKTAAAPKAKVVTVKKTKHYAKRHRHHRLAMHKKHHRHMAAHKTHKHVRHVKKHRKHVAQKS
jgi:hypothetical protein